MQHMKNVLAYQVESTPLLTKWTRIFIRARSYVIDQNSLQMNIYVYMVIYKLLLIE